MTLPYAPARRPPSPPRRRARFAAPMLAGLLLAALPPRAPAATPAPLLRCAVSYAGTTHAVDAKATDDPYTVAATDIGGRFAFKPVLLAGAQGIAAIKLYVYFLTSRQPVIIHQATFRPPFGAAPGQPFTGEQRLYAGPLERELTYSCSLEGAAA